MVKVSLFASSVRPKLYESFFESLKGTNVEYEVVFVGNNFDSGLGYYGQKYGTFTYIKTSNIKPAQCYEIARRHCTGEVVVWGADDMECSNNVIGKAYDYWKSQNNEKLILSIQTRETGYKLPEGKLFDMNIHRFFAGDNNSPLMAPLGMMSRKFLNDLGGLDKRYVSGQYENDIVMRAYAQGAKVEIFGNQDCFIDIDHLGKSILIGESKDERDFLNRPFAQGYKKDREILENSWTKFNEERFLALMSSGRNSFYPSEIKEIVSVRNDAFEPYEETDILIKSQSNKGIWE